MLIVKAVPLGRLLHCILALGWAPCSTGARAAGAEDDMAVVVEMLFAIWSAYSRLAAQTGNYWAGTQTLAS